ncbi:RING finger and SPRY domain-containing protein 1 [Modicella reniformis]|uniref:RING finger and SPRY domain-containing protein 1 n=1 Tax=Modicella reniformis TaxID=1440133 RepID=A0A9P6MC15_9FUNG|nr:RING finger and SPRY domain-containing protein 1 [Modicella reniformis]
MNRMATRLLERVFIKVHIRAAWNKLNNMTEHSELSSALESLIHLTASESSYCELLGVMVDMISTDSLGIAAPFLSHIIDMAALPSQQATRRMSQQLLSKCDPSGFRLRSKKKNKPTAALIWSVLANRLAGEMSSILFTDAVCECLLNNIENDPDMACKVFSIIALEKFSLTGPCKTRIMKKPIRRLLRDVTNLSMLGQTNPEEISGILQAKFCAQWSLRNVFREAAEVAEGMKAPAGTESCDDQSHSIAQTEEGVSTQGSLPSAEEGLSKLAESATANINVMLNTLDATRHWKISEDGLSIRNDGSTFESIRATKSVSQGKWYYEVTLVTAGIILIGWASVHCQFSPDDGTGVGDDIFGFAYDGCRNLMWADGESVPYGGFEAWKPGDVIGLYLDIDNAITECFIDGKSLGKISPFERDHFGIQAISGYFPALSFTSFQQAIVNFGATPFSASADAAVAAIVNAVVSQQHPSMESLARRRNTVAAPSSSSSVPLEMDCLDDPFSPPSTAYFAFLNRPSRVQRSSLHPMDMESVDPLELTARRPRHHRPLTESSESSTASQDHTAFPPLGPLGSTSEIGGVGPLDGEPSLGFNVEALGQGHDPTAIIDTSVMDTDVEDNNGMDVVLVEEGREASGSEVMEQSALDFQDGHSIHSRRNSVQVLPSLPPIGETTVATISTVLNGGGGASSMTATTISTDFARTTGGGTIPMSSSNMSNTSSTSTMNFSAGIGVGVTAVGNSARFGSRRASMPTNRLEM